MRAENTLLNPAWMISVFSLPSQAEWDDVSAVYLGVLLYHPFLPFLPCLPLPLFLSCCGVCEPQSHAGGLCEPLYPEKKISKHKKFLCPGSLVALSLAVPCFLAQALLLSGWVWLKQIEKRDNENPGYKWWKMSVLFYSVVIFCLLMCPYVSCVYFCETWCELTLRFITFTLTHGAVVGHQRAQSWAHLFRSHNQDTCSGLSSWVLSVRVWRHMKNTIRGLFTVLFAYQVLPTSDEPLTMVTAGQRSQRIHVPWALG